MAWIRWRFWHFAQWLTPVGRFGYWTRDLYVWVASRLYCAENNYEEQSK